ncbi:MAG: fimbrillin family protein [Dysgonamonadaceae bacterium]|jgi:hypothetical protein|nr:fimbrillin family protein [Dysgonamonadaceae bacterium]
MKATTIKMSVMLLSLTLALGSCEKEFPEDKRNGALIPVKFNILGVTEGVSEELTRSGSVHSEPETVVLPLDNGLSLEISLEQDAPVLRDGTPQSLPDGITYRLMAVDVSSNELLALADGVTGSTIPELFVPASSGCRFYALSYKTSETILPAYTVGNILSTLAVDNTKDFLLWNSGTGAMTKEIDGSYLLNITFRQELVRVKLIIDSQLTGRTVETIAANITIGEVATNGTLSYPTRVVTPSGTLSSPAFSWTTPASNQENSVRLVFPKASSTVIVTLPVSAIKLQGVAAIPIVSTLVPFTTALERGNSYTVRIKIIKITQSNKFASSNIYWDGSKLTFKPYSATPSAEYGSSGTTEPNAQFYQGVYFQYGSLIGISPVGTFSFSSTPIYVPYYGDGKSPGWRSSFAEKNDDDLTGISGAGSHGAWTSALPYITDGSSITRDNYHAMDPNQNTPTMWNSFKGDICQYISATQPGLSGYRLPFINEYGGSSDIDHTTTGYTSHYKRVGSFSILLTSDRDDGKYIINDGTMFSHNDTDAAAIFFPASGYRYWSPNYDLTYTGRSGYYHTGSSSGANVHNFHFNVSYVYPNKVYSRLLGKPIRCVRQE